MNRVRVTHEPDWLAVNLPVSSGLMHTAPGYVCVHGMEDGSGPCGARTFAGPEPDELDQASHNCWVWNYAVAEEYGARWTREELTAMATTTLRIQIEELQREEARWTARGSAHEKVLRALDEEREPAYGLCDTAYDERGRALRRATLKRPVPHQEWGGGQAVMSPGWPS